MFGFFCERKRTLAINLTVSAKFYIASSTAGEVLKTWRQLYGKNPGKDKRLSDVHLRALELRPHVSTFLTETCTYSSLRLLCYLSFWKIYDLIYVWKLSAKPKDSAITVNHQIGPYYDQPIDGDHTADFYRQVTFKLHLDRFW
jgi:hypothetical protein